MGIDPFAALGVDPAQFGPPPQSGAAPGADGTPTMTIKPEGKGGGIDPFAALGVDPKQSFEATAPSGAAAQQQQYPVRPGQMTGWSPVIGAGIKRGVIGAASALVDPPLSVIAGPVDRGPGVPAGMATPFADMLRRLGGDPDQVVPSSRAQELGGAAAEGAGAMVAMTPGLVGESVPRTLATLGKTALTGGVGGALGQSAQNAAPEGLKPAAGLAGNLVGNMGAEAAAQGAARTGGFVARKIGEQGVGPKKEFGGVRATGSQATAAGQQISGAIGPEGQANVTRSIADEKEAQGLEARLQDASLHPDERTDIQARLDQINKDARRVSLVPESESTTGQVAGTAGARNLELDVRKAYQPAFEERAEQNNNARLGFIGDQAPAGAEPASIGQRVASVMAGLEQGGQNQINAARGTVESTPAFQAGQQHIETYGGQMRTQLKGAASPWQQAYRRAWALVDPDGTWAIQSQPLRDKAAQLLGEASPTAETDNQVNRLMGRAAAMPAAVKFSDLSQMRADANAAIARLSGTRGMEPEMRRLTIFKQGIDSTIAASVDEKAALDPTLAGRLGEAGLGGDEVGPGGAGQDGQVGAGPNTAGGSAGVPGPVRGVGAGAAGRADASGAGAVPPGPANARPPGKPASLVDWIIANGGVQDQGGDLAAMDAQLIHHQRGGRLVNPNGMTLDRALEGAQAEGYLGRQGGGANPIGINDLIDAIGGEARGNPVYRGADMAQANEAEAGQRATQQNQAWEEKVYQARDHVNVWNEQAGQQPLPKEVQDHAAQLVASGAHPEDAVRSAWRESEDRELQANATRNAVGSPGVPLAAQQATMDVEGGNRLTPNMTSENAANYTAANQATRDYKQRFAQGGVGNILRPGQNFQDFRTPEGNVPRQIFTGGNTEPAEVQHWIQAVGGVDQATPMARDVLANDLRTRRIIDPVSGQVNAGKLAQWMEARKATFEQLPQLRDEFANLHQNQEWLNDMVGKHTAAMKELQDTAAARFVGEDVPGAVRRALAGGPQAFGQLTRMIRGDPAAEAGLKRAMVNEIISRTKSLTPSSDGFDMMTPGGFRKFMDKYRDSLKPVFGGQGVNNLERVAAMMRRESEGTKAIAGSQTASHQARSRLSGIGAKVGHSGVTTALALLGDHLGEMIGGNGIAGAIGLAGGVAAKSVWDSMRQAAINTRSDLLREAMLHPDLASALMERADARGQISTMTQRRIAAALQGAVTSNVGTRH